MRTTLIIVIAAMTLSLAIGMSGCATTARAAAVDPDEAAAAALREEVAGLCAQMEQAMRDNDLKRVASFYADDGILLGPSGQRRGGSRAALEEYWARFGTGIDWSLITHSVEGRDNMAVQRGRSVLTYINPEGARHTSVVDFMLIWQRQDDGTLMIAVDAYW